METIYFFFALFTASLNLLWTGSNTMKCSDDIISNGRDALRNRLEEDLGYIPGTIYHLWHGDLSNRNYMGRHELMAQFDPYRDIQHAPSGAWLWSDPQSELARNVRDYFRSRKEDG